MFEFLSKFLRNEPPPTPSQPALSAGSIGWSEPSAIMADGKYNPDDLIGRKGFDIYKRMMLDEQVKSAVYFKRATVIGRDYQFELDHERHGLDENEAKRRIDVYATMLEDGYRGSFIDGLKGVMKSMWQGFSMTEQIFSQFKHTFDGERRTFWGLKELKPKPFDTFHPIVTDTGDVVRWEQRGGYATRPITIDMSKFVYHRHNPETDEHYGGSELRAAYRPFISKDITIKYMNIFVERLAGGFPVASPKDGHSLDPDSEDWRTLVDIMKNITGKASLILPTGIDLEVHTVTGSQVDVFTKAIEQHDLAIAKSLLMPNLLGMSHSGQTGSYSQSETQFDVFMIISDEEADRLEDVLNEQVFGPLGRVNFPDGIAPRLKFKPLSRRKRALILKAWQDMLTAGGVTATETDERHVRELLDFPEAGEPLQKEVPVAEDPANRGSPRDDPSDDDETTPVGRGEEDRAAASRRRRGVSSKAFARAESRVSFAVIDRQAETGVADHVPNVESALAEAVAEALVRIEENQLGSRSGQDDKIGRFDMDGVRTRPINTQISRALRAGFAIGRTHASQEIDKAKKERFSRRLDMDRLGDLAEEYLKSKSFTIAGDLRAGVIGEIRKVLLNGVKYSWTQREIKRSIYKALASKGFLSGPVVAEALGIDDLRALAEELDLQGGLAPYRLETVVRTNMFEAINEARYDSFTDPALGDFVRALEYSSILDARTTSVCSHMDGRVYAASSEVWNRWRPPNHFNCRSILIPVTEVDEDVELTEAAPTILPHEGFGS